VVFILQPFVKLLKFLIIIQLKTFTEGLSQGVHSLEKLGRDGINLIVLGLSCLLF